MKCTAALIINHVSTKSVLAKSALLYFLFLFLFILEHLLISSSYQLLFLINILDHLLLGLSESLLLPLFSRLVAYCLVCNHYFTLCFSFDQGNGNMRLILSLSTPSFLNYIDIYLLFFARHACGLIISQALLLRFAIYDDDDYRSLVEETALIYIMISISYYIELMTGWRRARCSLSINGVVD